MKIAYITSNLQKFEEAQFVLHDWELINHPLDLVEIQGDPEHIIHAKALEAYQTLGHALIVEDVSLHCPAIGGLPGPYIKDFLRKLGDDGLYELIHKYEDHSVEVLCSVGYIDTPGKVHVFQGRIEGTIVAPRGEQKHGTYSWNSIVLPKGFDKTFGEMTLKDHSKFSMRYHALTKLKHFLELYT